MLTSISSSFQKEARPFANLFGLVILTLQKMKKDQSIANVSHITPSKSTISHIEESSQVESEGHMPKDSCDETNSYYRNGSRHALSSNEPTPDQPKPKKSPVKRSFKSPTKVLVKKGYLSSENNSAGSHNKLADYTSPSVGKAKKINPNAVKRTVDLRTAKKFKNFDSPKPRHTNTVYKKPNVKKAMVSDSEARVSHTHRLKALNKSNTQTALNNYDKSHLSAPETPYQKSGIKVTKREVHYNETTDESEDPFHEHNTNNKLKAYDKRVHGGMLYAFLELNQCQKVDIKPYLISKSESYNPTESNYHAYNNAIVNTGITGVSRQFSEQIDSKSAQTSSLSNDDYQRVLELKNQRMKGILFQK